MIITERLIIRMSTDDEMRKMIAEAEIDELKQAYSEMLSGAVNNPEDRHWYVMWRAEFEDGTHIGDLSFKGFENGVAEIGYGINEEFRCKGYATEAVTALSHWAFFKPEVERIEAETEESNEASKKVLVKSGFVRMGINGEEGPRYVLWREED